MKNGLGLLNLDRSSDRTAVEMYQMHQNAPLKWVNFMVFKRCLHRAVKNNDWGSEIPDGTRILIFKVTSWGLADAFYGTFGIP